MDTFNKLSFFLTELREIVLRRPPGAARKEKAARPPIDVPRLALSAGLDLIAVALFLAVLWILISPLLKKAGYAPGFDVPAHMYVTQRFAEGLRATGHLPAIDLLWYGGLEITHKLPPLAYMPLTVVYLLTNNAMSASRVFFLVLLALMGLSMYVVVRLTGGRVSAWAAAIVVALCSAGIDPRYGIISSYTRYFSFLFLPWAIFFAKRLLDGRLAYTWALAATLALMFPSHPMVAAISVMWLSVYALSRLALERRSVFFFKYFIFAYLLSVLMAMWYLGPYLFEEPVWGATLPTGAVKLYSIKIVEQLRQFGWFFGLLLLISLFLDFSRQRLAMLLASLFGFVYALGVYSPLVTLPRILNLAYPTLAYFTSIIGLTYLIFTSRMPKFGGRRPALWGKHIGIAAATIFLVAAVVFETSSRTHFGSFKTWRFSPDQINVAARIRREKPGARVMSLGPAFDLEMLALPLKAKVPSPEGQYSVMAPFYLQITQFYDNLRKGYFDVGRKKLGRWNSNFVLVTPYLKEKRDYQRRTFGPMLKSGGYKQIYKNASFKLYKQPRRTAYVQRIAERTLIIGRFAPVAQALDPDSIVIEKSVFVDDYNLADLKNFSTLILYGFTYRDISTAERLLKAYIRQGGVVLINMQSLDEYSYTRDKVFFNVSVKRKKGLKTLRFKTTGPNRLGLPDLKPARIPPDWPLFYYGNLDRTLVEAEAKGKNYPVVGYKKIGPGKVYFIGGDLLFYGYNKHRQDIINLVDKLIAGSRTKRPAPISVSSSVRRFAPTKMVFTYRADRAWPALVSRTYSPHWRASLNGGKELRIIKTEGLMGIDLPGGKHTVTLWYGPTPIHMVSKIITFFAWVSVIYMAWRWRRLDLLDLLNRKKSEVGYV